MAVLASIGGQLWRRQAQIGVNFNFGVQFELQVQSQSAHETTKILIKLLCTSGPNLVIVWKAGSIMRIAKYEMRIAKC